MSQPKKDMNMVEERAVMLAAQQFSRVGEVSFSLDFVKKVSTFATKKNYSYAVRRVNLSRLF